ncbi:MAG: sigma-54 dependent transcriptional regulator [Bacteroidales bacterium]|nr:sigma-54 dependent transcriptional regulator [Bacteroidales bacterium]
MEKLQVLILDDEPGIRSEIEEFLVEMNFEVFQAGSPSEAFRLLGERTIDVAIVDIRLPEMDGIDVLQEIKRQYLNTEVIMITAHGEMDSVIRCMRLGAIDFFNKPFRLKDLDRAIQKTKAYLQFQSKQQSCTASISKVSNELAPFIGHEIIGTSRQMQEVVKFMCNVSSSDKTTVLISGESGTGKELVAKGIHYLSQRKRQPFHSINCASVPDELFESEFFGHTKGAFSGAVAEKAGWFEASHRGTLFMDEIGDLKLSTQPKFLRVLDDMIVTRLGSTKGVKIDVRVIAATNHSLDSLVEDGLFRPDLYYRLNSFTIHLPPLRKRKEDIIPLFQHFLRAYAKAIEKQIDNVDSRVFEWLPEYYFPGNVRELKHMVERAIILCNGTTLDLSHFINPGKKLSNLYTIRTDDGMTSLHELEKQTIIQSLAKAKYVKSHAARLLNISRQALDRKIDKFKISI